MCWREIWVHLKKLHTSSALVYNDLKGVVKVEIKNNKINQLVKIIESELKQREFTVEEFQDLIIKLQTAIDLRRYELDRELFWFFKQGYGV